MRRKIGIAMALLSVLCVQGCKTGVLPDPNDPADVGMLTPETVRRNLFWANSMLLEREHAGEITPAQSREFIAERAKELATSLDISKVNPEDAWEFGEIFMTAKEWKGARVFLQQAVKAAKNNDRKVNDSLRLAQVDARLGDYDDALKLARSTFAVPDTDGAPVLPAVYLEIAPIVWGHGHDVELGKLIVDAVAVHQRVVVDPSSEAGKAFLFARPHHVLHALELALELFQKANRPDLVQAVQKQLLQERSHAPIKI